MPVRDKTGVEEMRDDQGTAYVRAIRGIGAPNRRVPMDVHDIVGTLTKKEVLALVPPGRFTTYEARTWDSLKSAIAACPVDVREMLFAGAQAKAKAKETMKGAKRKRKVEDDQGRHVRRRMTGKNFIEHCRLD
jgi:hypothetical protein